MDSSFIYITRTRYSKGWKQIATAFLDASNCCCQECGEHILSESVAISRTRNEPVASPLLNPWRKTITLSQFQSNDA
ncbi:hypothetical protein LC613_34250 [Nostoc sphaeroides CHAB 2801]|uniref:hypothetical protein n=1 Tax=Nostoc sphaeroides TaxID=446679 RepID=UPI001E3A7798|nr:hypothetical protein [Nostoc sphaeroides]MCC5632663.1 hypothetical protein [Nostoc sphaeroides CHAB 2801]